MRKFFKALAAAVFAVLISGPVMAQQFDVPLINGKPYTIGQTSGKQMELTSSATSSAVDFGFFANYVEVCLVPSQTQSVTSAMKVLGRFGTTLTASTGAPAFDPSNMTVVATSMTIFENGDTLGGYGTVKGRAMAFSSPATTNSAILCRTYPFHTRGMIFAASGNATINVNGFVGP